MPAGLQCWDASGKLIVDIGDYNTRLIDTFIVTMQQGAASTSIAHPQATLKGCFAVITKTSKDELWSSGILNSYAHNYATRCLDGVLNIFSIEIAGASRRPKIDLTINLYGFL